MIIRDEPSSCAVRVISQISAHFALKEHTLRIIEDTYGGNFAKIVVPLVKEVRANIKEWLNPPPDKPRFYGEPLKHSEANRIGTDIDLGMRGGTIEAKRCAIVLDALVREDICSHAVDWGAETPSHHYVGYFTEYQFKTRDAYEAWSETLVNLGWDVKILGESRHRNYNIGMIAKYPTNKSRWR